MSLACGGREAPDTRTPARLRAGAAGIPAYWIINLPERCVEVFSHPTNSDPSGYLVREVFHEGDRLRLMIDDQEYGDFPVAAILP